MGKALGKGLSELLVWLTRAAVPRGLGIWLGAHPFLAIGVLAFGGGILISWLFRRR